MNFETLIYIKQKKIKEGKKWYSAKKKMVIGSYLANSILSS